MKRGRDDVQLGVHISVQQPVRVVDRFVATRVDLGATDERRRQAFQIRPLGRNMLRGRDAVANSTIVVRSRSSVTKKSSAEMPVTPPESPRAMTL